MTLRMAVPAQATPLPATRMAGLRRPAVALIAAAALGGVAVSGTKYALGGFDPVTLLSIELLAGAGVLWAALLIRGYRPPGSWWLPVLLGLLEPALAYLGDTWGLSLTSAVHGALINGLESALVVMLAAMLLRETITRPAIISVMVALGGLLVLAGAGAGRGPAAMLVGAGGFGVSFLLFNMVIARVDAGRAAVVLNLIPVFGVASAVVFLGEGVTSRDALGAVLVGSSVLYFAIADSRDATA